MYHGNQYVVATLLVHSSHSWSHSFPRKSQWCGGVRDVLIFQLVGDGVAHPYGDWGGNTRRVSKYIENV
jgi:hypothetical protein